MVACTANDGLAALEALKTYRPTVVFLDIGMPGMDGYEIARQPRQQPEGRDVMLVALTGWARKKIAANLRRRVSTTT